MTVSAANHGNQGIDNSQPFSTIQHVRAVDFSGSPTSSRTFSSGTLRALLRWRPTQQEFAEKLPGLGLQEGGAGAPGSHISHQHPRCISLRIKIG